METPETSENQQPQGFFQSNTARMIMVGLLTLALLIPLLFVQNLIEERSLRQKEVIRERKLNPQDESYTSSLFRKGINKIAQKVGEEAVEVVIESKDDDADLFKNEVSDLLFHLLVLLEQKNIDLDEVIGVLRSRHQ